jgi:polysaccharide deacetylase family protein (PEP-CTERM system associated)
MRFKPILSVDVEDWLQSTWNRDAPIGEVARKNTLALLERLDRLDVKVTMFILGKFAETFPDVVLKILDAGHEIAAHGYGHREIFTQTRAQFREDIRRNKDHLEQLTGKQVAGFRAPDFSIVKRSIWALEELAEAGFVYDSSIFPVHGGRYGIPSWPLAPASIRLAGGKSIIEFPITAYPLGGKNRPVGGGGYHRLLPGFIIRRIMRNVLDERPFVSYMHPYEFNPHELAEMQERVPYRVKLHQGLFRSRFGPRFDSYVKQFGGITFSDFLQENRLPEVSLETLRID